MTSPGPRRSRRHSRAKSLGVPLTALAEQRPHAVPVQPGPAAPAPAHPYGAICCRIRSERTLGLGGTVFMIHRHQPACPRWTSPAPQTPVSQANA
ncbi:hypothetical protein [Kitasatospora aureofaciens]|uniref:hypothetical protein n=1 Tax=Kitasatospora aureofaciens TaxID=1894 RepID=UPI001C459623|nr:hypothetical protein [Kitasatospora aureofaciens]MBV6702965.1 hypothetical protein [Kitasatospora aureofaciens]